MGSRVLVVGGRLAVRLVPAALLLWGGFAKAFDRQSSILAVDAYDVLPEVLVRPVAAILPWVEIAVGVLLVLGLFMRFAAIATVVLASVFILGMAQAKARGLAIDCGCFGGGGSGAGVSWWEIARDVLFVLVPGIYLAIRPRGPWQLDNRSLNPPDDRSMDPEDDDGELREADEALSPARAG